MAVRIPKLLVVSASEDPVRYMLLERSWKRMKCLVPIVLISSGSADPIDVVSPTACRAAGMCRYSQLQGHGRQSEVQICRESAVVMQCQPLRRSEVSN